jgi:hypothetical protein
MQEVNIRLRVVDEAGLPLKGFSVAITVWGGSGKVLTKNPREPILYTQTPTDIPCEWNSNATKLTLFGPADQNSPGIENYTHSIRIYPDHDLDYTFKFKNCPDIDAYSTAVARPLPKALVDAHDALDKQMSDFESTVEDAEAVIATPLLDLCCKTVSFKLLDLDDRRAKYDAVMYYFGKAGDFLTPEKEIVADNTQNVFHLRESSAVSHLRLTPHDASSQVLALEFRNLRTSHNVRIRKQGQVISISVRRVLGS